METVRDPNHSSSSHVQSSYLKRSSASSDAQINSDLPSIRKISSDDERYLFLVQFLDGDLEGISLALKIYKDRRIHADLVSNASTMDFCGDSALPDLQSSCAQDSSSLILSQVGSGCALLFRNLFVGVARWFLHLIWIARDNNFVFFILRGGTSLDCFIVNIAIWGKVLDILLRLVEGVIGFVLAVADCVY